MLSSKFQTLGLMAFISTLIVVLVIFFGNTGSFKASNSNIQSIVSAAIYNNRSELSRTQRGELVINKSAFESDVNQQIKRTYPNAQISYEYLNDTSTGALNGSIVAVRVYTKINNDTYRTTTALNKANQSNDLSNDIDKIQGAGS